MFTGVSETAEKWGISERRVRILCSEGRAPGTHKEGKIWKTLSNATKPTDERFIEPGTSLPIINEKLAKLNTLRPLTEEGVARLLEDFMIEYTYNTSAIEGNTLILRETDMVLRGLTIGKKPLKDHIETVSHKEAFYFVIDLVKENRELTESLIKQIHHLVLGDKKEDRGVYRKVPVRVMGASHGPVQPYLIEPKMEELLINYKASSEHIVTRLAKLHIEFKGIHPFVDGNGRTGRPLVNLELMKEGTPPVDTKFADRTKYYEAFDEYHVRNNLSEMESLFAPYVNERLDGYLRILEIK